MDNKLTWEQMNLETQLNCHCNTLAKSVIARAIGHNLEAPRVASGTLPKEQSAIFISQGKIMLDPTKALQCRLSK
jgi:hypothetical protein